MYETTRERGLPPVCSPRLHFIYQRKLSRSGRHARSLSPPEGEERKAGERRHGGAGVDADRWGGGCARARAESADGLRAKSGARRNPGIPGSACALSRWIDRPRARVPFPPL